MSFRVKFWQNIFGKREIEVTTLNIVDGMLVKGKYRTPISNIKYIEDLS